MFGVELRRSTRGEALFIGSFIHRKKKNAKGSATSLMHQAPGSRLAGAQQ
jgi:hypothetical protein